jgi:4-amino-4-deoxy-L-arabinose transferase-like glycosyltransferase
MRPNVWIWLILGTGTAFRLALAGLVGPGNDEAYYCLFADHLDWSYFDHPPLVGWLAAAGRWAFGAPRSILAHRVGFVLVFTGSTWLMYRLGTRLGGPVAGVTSAVLLNATAYYGLAAGTFVLPDGPLLFFWLLFLDRVIEAIDEPGGLGAWAAAGFAAGGALLSKYHGVLLAPGYLLLVVLEPKARRAMLGAGPYLAAGVASAIATPVVLWNARHGWASIAFQGARAIGGGFRPGEALATVGGQMIYLLPWIGVPLAWVLVVGARGYWREGTAAERALWAFGAVPIVTFSLIAFMKPVFPHWGLIGFATLIPLLAARWACKLEVRPATLTRRLLVVGLAPVVLGLVGVAQARTGFLTHRVDVRATPRALAADPTLDLAGWREIAEGARRLARPGEFVFTGHWYSSGQVAFAMPEGSAVLCYSTDPRSFGVWSRPNDWVGRDAVLVAVDDRSAEPGCFEPYFSRIEPAGEFWVSRGGRPARHVRIFRCVGQVRPFPFGPRGEDREEASGGLAEGSLKLGRRA